MKEFVEKLIERLEEKSFIMQCADNRFHNFINIDKIKNTINQLAEEFATDINVGSKNQGWIPCSERLPRIEEGEIYPDVIITDKNGVVEVAFYNEYDKEWYVMDVYSEEYEVKKDVIAWMHLPSPYKPEEKQEEPQTNFYAERFNRVI